eukprot:8921872-Alexandrium_andersonii.AAC.1
MAAPSSSARATVVAPLEYVPSNSGYVVNDKSGCWRVLGRYADTVPQHRWRARCGWLLPLHSI